MRIVTPRPGDDVGDFMTTCYFELIKNSDEPIIAVFNEVTVLFSHDSEGLHRNRGDLDSVAIEGVEINSPMTDMRIKTIKEQKTKLEAIKKVVDPIILGTTADIERIRKILESHSSRPTTEVEA